MAPLHRRLHITLFLLASCQQAMSGGSEIELDDDSELLTRPGQRGLQVFCRIYPSDEYTYINVSHVHPITGEARLLGQKARENVTEVISEGYNVTFTIRPFYNLDVTLTVDEVKDIDDGAFAFRAVPDPDTSTYHDILLVTKNVTVIRNITSMSIGVGNTTSGHETPEVDVGSHQVTCATEGSNPAATNFTLRLNQQVIVLRGEPSVQLSDSQVRRYRTEISATVNLTTMATLYTLECLVTDTVGMTESIHKLVRTITPVIDVMCNETRVTSATQSPVLYCHVSHVYTGPLTFAFQVVNSSQVINETTAHAYNATFTTSQLSSSVTEIRLTLNQVSSWLFESQFVFLVNGLTMNATPQRVYVRKLYDDGGCNGNVLHRNLYHYVSVVLTVLVFALFL